MYYLTIDQKRYKYDRQPAYFNNQRGWDVDLYRLVDGRWVFDSNLFINKITDLVVAIRTQQILLEDDYE